MSKKPKTKIEEVKEQEPEADADEGVGAGDETVDEDENNDDEENAASANANANVNANAGVTANSGLNEHGAKTPIAVGITEIKHEPVAADASLPAVANGDVMMTFPKPVNVIDRGIMHKFAVGRHAVPAALVKHWYLAANGVELVK